MARSPAFEALLPPVFDGLWRFARKLAGDGADDLLQQALVVALGRFGQLRDERAFRVWVTRIVYRTWVDDLRKRREQPMDPATVDGVIRLFPGPDDETDARRLRTRLDAAFALLPEEQRHAVLLVDGEGFQYGEVAEILGIAPGTAASRVARGRLALRVHLSSVARELGVAP
jgi:RNA polymerase sigma-70 factor (ECF subfamily)